jgi:hypothetical protein
MGHPFAFSAATNTLLPLASAEANANPKFRY